MRLAGIDIGTLTCRLLIADVDLPQQFTEVFADRRILRLGEGVDQQKRLSLHAINRVVDTLMEWKDNISKYSVDEVVVVATSAVRESENRQEFRTRVKQATGWEVEVLSGEEEAKRTLLGLKFGLPATITDFIGLDIGGGSTECLLVSGGRDLSAVSLDLGVVRLSERFFHRDPPTRHDLQKAETCIDEIWKTVKQSFGEIQGLPLVGTAGTITTLAAMAQGLKQYDRAKVHNFPLNLSNIQRLEDDLRAKPARERLAMPGLEPGREHVIVAGIVILRGIMQILQINTCLVSDYGLREGILVHCATKKS